MDDAAGPPRLPDPGAPDADPRAHQAAPMPPPLALPALHASHSGVWLRRDGSTRGVGKGEAVAAAADTPVLLLGAPIVANRLGYPDISGLDLLELWAFVHPARFLVPTARGLAHALALPQPPREDDVPALLQAAAGVLLAQTAAADWASREGAWGGLDALARLRWPWATLLSGHIRRPDQAERWLFSRLPAWDEAPERPQPAQVTLDEGAVLARLDHLTGTGLGAGADEPAEARPGQRAYAAAAARAFAPRPRAGSPHLVLAEAGTGTGKTLGYLAPASLWAEQAGGTVWVSTYTKALQRQLRRESRRAWPDDRRADGSPRVVVRKGRENYLCLLNLEDALQGGFGGRAAVLAQLVARWAAYTRDGDMIGGDLPGWLGTLFRQRGIASLTDRRGECVYAGCPHYRTCFIERATRDSAGADLVIANHALVMINAARAASGGARDGAPRPTRIVFDEGHHVFDAADATFAADLTGAEAIELRRWVLGPDTGARGGARGRRRGLAARLADIASYDEAGGAAIAAARDAAEALPGEGWLARIAENAAWGPIEHLLAAVRATVLARDESGSQDAGYALETEAAGLDGPLIEAAGVAEAALAALRLPLQRLGVRLEAILADPPDWLDGQGRARVEGARHALGWRIELIAAWEALLARLGGPADPAFVDWLALDRAEAREFDIGIHRRWLDPMKPFAEVVLAPAHGVMLTSATLRDPGERAAARDADDRAAARDADERAAARVFDDPASGWDTAIARTGVGHIASRPALIGVASPFDYARQAEVLIVTDVPRGDIPALAAAYGRLIEASRGGALGLFTAIRRLRAVHGRIADRLARMGLPLHAQHVDPIDTGTLVDIFRDDPAASLLGTDALRDGVDVPGVSLRLVIMEQVPWPKPSILHRARRLAAAGTPGGGQAHDDRIIRARLAQAFGRLIRAQGDRGHFVVLSAALPSRLLSAFPTGTPIVRLTLDEALHRIGGHALHGHGAPPAGD